jgi:hypothetical protein
MNWLKSRMLERTSLDGITIIVLCVSIILFGGIAKMLAWAGLLYGAAAFVIKEK